MKNNIINILAGLGCGALLTLSATSCFPSFEEANKPDSSANREEISRDNFLGGSFLSDMFVWTFPQQENRYQMTQDLIGNQYARYTSNIVPGFTNGQFPTFNAPDNWAEWPYQYQWPKMTANLKELERETGKESVEYALATLFKVHTLIKLTDTYGPFPVGTTNDPNAYVSQKDVYKGIIEDLNFVSDFLSRLVAENPDLVVFSDIDAAYEGKIINWYKVANSLKLRVANRISGVDPALAKELAEKAITDGVIETNDQNLTVLYVPAGLYKVSVEWKNVSLSADIDVYLNGYKDPRLGKFASAAKKTTERSYIGCLTAAPVKNMETAANLYSLINFPQNKRSTWINAAEMAFCRAEGALLGWNVGGTAQQFYEKGIQLSFEEWGAGDASDYINDSTNKPASYTDAEGGYGKSMSAPSEVTIKWDEDADQSVKLEKIMTQKWIAMFPNGPEAWAEMRRTGYPHVLPLGTSATLDMKYANRVPYPVTENIKNPEGYAQMLTLLGGPNDYSTKMWWQN